MLEFDVNNNSSILRYSADYFTKGMNLQEIFFTMPAKKALATDLYKNLNFFRENEGVRSPESLHKMRLFKSVHFLTPL